MKYTGNLPGLLESIVFAFPSEIKGETMLDIRRACQCRVLIDGEESALIPLSGFPLSDRGEQWRIEVKIDQPIPPGAVVTCELVSDRLIEHGLEDGCTIDSEMNILAAVMIDGRDFERHLRN